MTLLAYKNLQDKVSKCIEKYFHVRVKGGEIMDVKKEAMTSITIRISQEEKMALQDRAKSEDRSVSYLIRQAIRQYLMK